MRNSTIRHASFYAGLFLIGGCTLMLQLVQTRILSVVTWYHLGFFVISMALFGLTAGAIWVYLHRDRFTGEALSYDLTYFSSAFGISTALSLAIQMTLVPVVLRSLSSLLSWTELALCLTTPFFFAGIVLSLALTRSPFPVSRVYGINMLGAGAGCIGGLMLLDITDGPSAVLWVGALGTAGALFFASAKSGKEPGRKLPFASLLQRHKTILLVLCISAIANGAADSGLKPLVVKGRIEAPRVAYAGETARVLHEEWNAFSRIVVYKWPPNTPHLWGPSPKMPTDKWSVDQRWLDIDGLAGTIAYHFTGDRKEVEFLKYDVTNLAYFLPDREQVAVIGAGAGADMLSAWVFGLRSITGIELNPIFTRLLTEDTDFANFIQLSKLKEMNFVVDEARSWLARTPDTFDIIQMSMLDSFAAIGAGAFTLSENGLYTIEAWKTILSRLTPDGVFTTSYWYSPSTDHMEGGRLLSLAMATLIESGIPNPRRHIFLAAQGRLATLIISRTPFSQIDLKALERAATRYEHQVLVTPSVKPNSEILSRIVTAAGRDQLDNYTSGLRFDLTPPTDDRPFFFNQLPLSKPLSALRLAKKGAGLAAFKGGLAKGNLLATLTLMVLLVASMALVTATIVVPIKSVLSDTNSRFATSGTFYFLLIGFGFMMIEIAFLQRLSVFLGHPSYSLSVVLFSLILSTGIGSLLSGSLKFNTPIKLAMWAALTGSYLIALPLWIPEIFVAFEGARTLTKAVVSLGIIAPAGILMGFGFPSGMRMALLSDPRPAPWLWGINAAAGVFASASAVACSITFGISLTLTIGAVCYLLLIPIIFIFFDACQPLTRPSA
jgi:predicted membrane-bound spermidine synthase